MNLKVSIVGMQTNSTGTAKGQLAEYFENFS